MIFKARFLFLCIIVLSLIITTIFQRNISFSYEDSYYGTDLPTVITPAVVVTTEVVATTNSTVKEESVSVAASVSATRIKATTAVVPDDDTQINQATTSTSFLDVPIITTKRKKRLKIIHVMNTYAIPVPVKTNDNDNDDSDNSTSSIRYMSPFDQWFTLKSVARALHHLRSNTTTSDVDVDIDIDVDFVCAMFESDYQNYFQYPENKKELVPCQSQPLLLKRSTKTEYNHILPSPIQELPFLQDLIDVGVAVGAAYSTAATPEYSTTTTTTGTNTSTNRDHNTDVSDKDDNDFFVMITNSDIGLTKNFYSQLVSKLNNKDAISINRITIPETDVDTTKMKRAYYHKYDNNGTIISDDDDASTSTTVVSSLFTKIERTLIRKGKKHMGWDCFLIHSSVVQRIQLGDLFAGYPPWGKVFHHLLTLHYVATNYTNYKSYTRASQGGTFHIGSSERKWLDSHSRHQNNNKRRGKQTKTETKTKRKLLKSNTALSSSLSLSLSLTQQQTTSVENENEDQQKNNNSSENNHTISSDWIRNDKLTLHLLETKCPLFSATGSSEPYSSLNAANCGILYSTTPVTSLLISNNNNNNVMGSSNNNNRTYYKKIDNGTETRTTYRNIPLFIRSGYEDIYLQHQQQQHQSKEDGNGYSYDNNWLFTKKWNISTASKQVNVVYSPSLLASSSKKKEN